MKPYSCDTISAPCEVAIHKDSHTISKIKPSIRIIHIFDPEIIKTDVANFRELVQRLTGKPAEKKVGKKKTSSIPTKELRTICPLHSKIMDKQEAIHILQSGDKIKKESKEVWGGEKSDGFLGGFADMDSLIQDMSEFPLLPFKTSHINAFGEMPLY